MRHGSAALPPGGPVAAASGGSASDDLAAEPGTADIGDAPDGGLGAWQAELARLDGIRQSAYAQGDPQLLSGVYAEPLLSADAAQLRAMVPGGCGLIGAATSYAVLSATPADEAPAQRQAQITATATLAAGQLICQGAVQGSSAELGPVTMQLVLRPGDDGLWRIAEQRRG
jgi:hypothetical protein